MALLLPPAFLMEMAKKRSTTTVLRNRALVNSPGESIKKLVGHTIRVVFLIYEDSVKFQRHYLQNLDE